MVSGFTRLKSLFSGSLNLKTYKDIVSVSKNAECRNLPNDLLGMLLSKGLSAKITKAEIAAVKASFAEASDCLAQGISIQQRAQRIQMQKGLASFDKSKIISLDFLREAASQKLMLEPMSCTRGINSASKVLTEGFSKIIPDCAKVEIKPLRMGSFGQGYRLEFLDVNGNKLIHDKVLKVFYGDGQSHMDLVSKMMPMLMEKSIEFSSQFTLRDVVKLLNNIKSITVEEVMTFLKPFEEVFAKQGVTVKPEDIEKGLSKLKSVKLKDLKPLFEIIKNAPSMEKSMEMGMGMLSGVQEHMSQIHGIYAEANTMMYLRTRLGHSLSKTNIVAPDYYNLKKGFSIAEFSDDILPAARSEVDFGLLGLEHQDLHQANKVAGRIIDLGGISIKTPELTDKLTLRYYKKIMNQKNPELRRKYILQLEKDIETMNDLDKQKVKRAINLSA